MLVTFINGSQNSKKVEYSVSNSALYVKIWDNISKMDRIDIQLKKQSLSSGTYSMESFQGKKKVVLALDTDLSRR